MIINGIVVSPSHITIVKKNVCGSNCFCKIVTELYLVDLNLNQDNIKKKNPIIFI